VKVTIVRFLAFVAILCAALEAGAETPAGGLLSDLKSKREKLGALHQEFDVSQASKLSRSTRSSQRQTVIDIFQGQWREKSVSGSGTRVRIFDGKDLFEMEDQGDEYIRTKLQSKDEDPAAFSLRFRQSSLGEGGGSAAATLRIARRGPHLCCNRRAAQAMDPGRCEWPPL
jgi:hypothetical protein